ncbi:MAG: hypothetical protein GY781_19740 [Gammaproteobacteria bacterium]|nr:hypothetical protein [Gammaproteobacteria bacterium]
MAYKKAELERMALEAIEKHELVYNYEVASFLPCSEATFYNWKLEKLESIKTALVKNKISIKSEMRSNWRKSDNATLQMGLMKLLGTEEERDALNGKPVNVTTNNMSVLRIEEV